MINDNIPRAKLYPIVVEQVYPTMTAHEYLQGVYRGQIIPNPARMSAARAALPFEKPKLIGVIADPKGDLADRLHAARARHDLLKQKRLEAMDTLPVPVLDDPPEADTVENSSAPDHDQPFPSDMKSRFRRL